MCRNTIIIAHTFTRLICTVKYSNIYIYIYKVLYCFLVRSILEFSTVVWNPKQINLIEKFGKIQQRFLRIIAFKLGKVDVGLNSIALELGLEPLTSKRLYNDVAFIYKLIYRLLNCLEFLQKINFRVPAFNSRNKPPFHVLQYTSNLVRNTDF